ncbi:conserved hypothetical protein [Theileria orientalis strain Shintoku]|uniref:Uncharacterized protein n=1 Tax=Theileria orientalis strain Shintoku TaxID=869250 RepID=J4DP90_THEOR|nr:conserved hypothetical protein [Theileria orientalis strain Shintoku]PVC51617.1 hypothetical protein MACL_00001401 [Theileria orientalis]BAM40294.1 conserved hypothetical protein [Theileria orientalis strain Shintoku]|eukprot:XP_009690595.1 conserved hypothetical protein [Theileria orientalis strain Shintoku]
MTCFGHNNTLEELRLRVNAAHPNLENDMEDLFDKNDISGEGFIPYGVVDALIRHYLMEKDLSDHVVEYLDHFGRLDLDYVRGFLHESNLLVVNEDTMLTCEDMKLLAVVWMKLVSDSYKSKKLNQTNEAEYYKNKLNYQSNTPYNELRLSINSSIEGNEDMNAQELMDSYMKSVREEVERNRAGGISCFAYPAALTPNGSCASAGAVIPYRRLRQRRERSTGLCALLGCC